MIRFIIFFIQFILLLIILSLVISNPFVVSFDIFDLKYSLSSNLFVGTFLSLIVVLYFLIFIYFKSRVSLNKFVCDSILHKVGENRDLESNKLAIELILLLYSSKMLFTLK